MSFNTPSPTVDDGKLSLPAFPSCTDASQYALIVFQDENIPPFFLKAAI